VKIPLVDLHAQYQSIAGQIDGAMHRVVESGAFILGPEVEAFEHEWATYCGSRHAVGVSNCTDALRLALLALDIGPGDEVITVSNTFFATGEAIATTGARPIFVDTDPRTQTLDPTKLAPAITSRTKAVLPVHLYGQVADMESILQVADEHGLPVIEDAAQAHGARFGNRKAGSLGKIGCFSFYPGKNLGAYGDAGALVTDDAAVAAKLRLLRDHGRTSKYVHTHVAYSCRMDGLQAAVLRTKLPHLDRWNERRRELANLYRERLEEDSRVTCIEQAKNQVSACHLMVIEIDRREEVRKQMAAEGIGVGVHYPVPLHLQPAFEPLGLQVRTVACTEASCNRVLSLPLYPELTDEQAKFVVQKLREALGSQA
jgi:dTDP-4-amino-4,6-dideoxygalactose transaminase